MEFFSLSPTVPGTIKRNNSPDARFDLGTDHVVRGQNVKKKTKKQKTVHMDQIYAVVFTQDTELNCGR